MKNGEMDQYTLDPSTWMKSKALRLLTNSTYQTKSQGRYQILGPLSPRNTNFIRLLVVTFFSDGLRGLVPPSNDVKTSHCRRR